MGKGLENLEIIKSIQTNNYDRKTNDYTSVNEEYEYEIEIIEKELKALEIIKEKNVDIFFLRNNCDTVEEYNEEINNNTIYYCYSNCRELTQEEFELLKRQKKMKSKNYIKDIQMFINEAYSDKEPLQENQIKSKQVFNDYCNEISQALDRLEKLEKIFSDSHICEIKARFDEIECSIDKCENCPLGIGDGICLKKTFERKWELQKENQELIKKADCCLWKDCNKISQENQDLKDTNMKYAKLIDDFQAKNMRLEKAIKKAIELLSIDGKGTKKQVLNLLKEMLKNE